MVTVAFEVSGASAVAPGFRLTEAGVIPVDWSADRLGDLVVRVGSGITPRGGERVYRTEGRPFVRSQNVGWGALIFDDIAFLDEKTHSAFASSVIEEGDVLLNITGASIGRTAVADSRVAGGNVNQHVCEIRTKRGKLDPTYLSSYLLSTQGQRQIDSFQAGGNRQGLNFSQIRSFVIPYPSPDEQVDIAEVLNDAAAALLAIDMVIAKKRAVRRAAMQQLLTGRTRLPGFTGDWRLTPFEEVALPRRTRVNPARLKEPMVCVELEQIESGTGRLLGASETSQQSSLKSVFEPGDVLFGKLRAYLRKFWFADRAGVCSTEIWVLVAQTARATPEYLRHLVSTDSFLDAASMAYGTHMPRSDWNVVRRYEVKLPPRDEQAAIAGVLSDMDTELEVLSHRRAKLEAMKRGIMQSLLTGRVRIKTGKVGV